MAPIRLRVRVVGWGGGGSRGVKEIRLTEFRATGQRTWEFISGRRSTTARYTLRSRVYPLLYPAPLCADSCVSCALCGRPVDDKLCLPGNVFLLLYSSVSVLFLFVSIRVLGEFQQAIAVKSRPEITKLAPILIPRTPFKGLLRNFIYFKCSRFYLKFNSILSIALKKLV